jgi:hypothetical protein
MEKLARITDLQRLEQVAQLLEKVPDLESFRSQLERWT